MECSTCNAHWPIINGVPSYNTAKYFGEISEEDIERLIAAAEREHWLSAARAQFKDQKPRMYQYIVDLNRAAWIPLLPIGPESTVLDVGSGLGTLTHALALHYECVVSVEPVEQRIRFTRIRLNQEGIQNVDLIQTTMDALPFSRNTFDLIILNGILEWVGEWRTGNGPREAQIEVLTMLRRMLRPGGLVLIGIENRIGFSSFLGRMDHSGLRFTNLMPRRIASLYLKARRPGFYRTLINFEKGYRTYTYSISGRTPIQYQGI
jgi:ubiquinone/menaquinone biosynthesis C-methylase UbiE